MKSLFVNLFQFLKKTDLPLLFILVILLLQGIGLVSLYSATHGADSSNNLIFFQQQIFWLLIGWLVFFVIYHLDYNFIKKFTWPFYGLHVLFLILILFLNPETQNVNRWLDLGWFHYQPSEFLKFVLVLFLSYKLSQRKFKEPLNILQLIEYGVFIFVPISLVMAQPDLGTAGINILILSTLIFFNGVDKKAFITIVLIIGVSLPLGWNFLLKPYQKSRITSFIHPEKDPKGKGYNVIQSKIAIGSGQLFGKGFTKGTQNQLQFLPERHTDFIFSVLSEEYGFLGSFITLALFVILIFFTLNYASTSRNQLGCYFCLGAGAFLFWEIFLNLAMTMGLFPVVGAPLPLISYGGSHTLTTMTFLGLVASVNKRKDLF